MSDFYTITFTGKKIESRKRLLHRSCRPRVYRFADKSSDDEEHYGRPQTRRNIDNDSEHASRDRASIDSAGGDVLGASRVESPYTRRIGISTQSLNVTAGCVLKKDGKRKTSPGKRKTSPGHRQTDRQSTQPNWRNSPPRCRPSVNGFQTQHFDSSADHALTRRR
ncbi:hypothetical protein J6590_107384 [Homalodisca vitripennis]|nr:hypothetical protein J6590_107384 [Homalodisca vitripennis]